MYAYLSLYLSLFCLQLFANSTQVEVDQDATSTLEL